jgi:hypothetical protein
MTPTITRDAVAKDVFLRHVSNQGHQTEPDKVIARDNVYRVDDTVHLMVRTSRFRAERGVYFFGLTRHIFENFAHLPHAVIAFVFSDTQDAILVPAHWMWQQRERISANAKQFKLEVNKSLQLKTLKESGKPMDLSPYRNRLDLLRASSPIAAAKDESKSQSDLHTRLQGMLLEIGNVRGFQTYCPNKSPRFKNKALGEIATVKSFPQFPGINIDIVRQIDVVWFEKSFPIHAFEVELTTGIWTGLVRLGELKRLSTVLHVVTDSDEKAFMRRISGDIFSELVERCHHAKATEVQELHGRELRVHELRERLLLHETSA